MTTTRERQPSFSVRGPAARKMLDDLSNVPALRRANGDMWEALITITRIAGDDADMANWTWEQRARVMGKVAADALRKVDEQR